MAEPSAARKPGVKRQEAPAVVLTCQIEGWRHRRRFGKTFTEYKMAVGLPPLEWTIFKRYTEFRDLHKMLMQSNPKQALPKLPSGKLLGKLKEEFIETRQAALAVYMEALLRVPQIFTSPVLLTFLGAMTSPSAEGKDIQNPQYHLHVDKVVEIVQQGDVFLFRTDGVLQSMQRTFTKSDYDHVGMVIRVPAHSKSDFSLFILEATSEGVKKYPLRQRLRAWSLSKASMSLRKLHVARTFEMVEALGKFVTEVDGLPYGLTPMKLLRRTPNNETQGNYFCSELVASAYKVMGLLPETAAPTAFLPVAFAAHNNLQLINGASLDREVLVSFHVPEVVHAKITASLASLISSATPATRVSADGSDSGAQRRMLTALDSESSLAEESAGPTGAAGSVSHSPSPGSGPGADPGSGARQHRFNTGDSTLSGEGDYDPEVCFSDEDLTDSESHTDASADAREARRSSSGGERKARFHKLPSHPEHDDDETCSTDAVAQSEAQTQAGKELEQSRHKLHAHAVYGNRLAPWDLLESGKPGRSRTLTCDHIQPCITAASLDMGERSISVSENTQSPSTPLSPGDPSSGTTDGSGSPAHSLLAGPSSSPFASGPLSGV